MLYPQQFEVNEAWIAFRMNRIPVQTERDDDVNVIALMDAAELLVFIGEAREAFAERFG